MEAVAALRELVSHPWRNPCVSIPVAGVVGTAVGAACGAAVGATIGAPVGLAAGVAAIATATGCIFNRAVTALAEKYNWKPRNVAILNILAMGAIGAVGLTAAVSLGILIPGSAAAVAISIGIGLGIVLYQVNELKKASSSHGPDLDL